MPTKEKLDEIAALILERLPDCEFLVLVNPQGSNSIAVCSTLPKHVQPMLANAFVQGCAKLETGEFVAVQLNTTH